MNISTPQRMPLRRPVVLTVVLVLSACRSAQSPAPETIDGLHGATGGEAAYFLFSELAVMRGAPPEGVGLHVVGALNDGRFMPTGGVRGDGPYNVDGSRGWVELTSGVFHSAVEARPPQAPYVRGALTDAGFVPESPTVHY